MTQLIPTNGGQNEINGLDIQLSPVVIFDFNTLEILATCDNYSKAEEISCDFFRKGIDARDTVLKFHDDNLNCSTIIGRKMNEFQDFVDNNTHPLIN